MCHPAIAMNEVRQRDFNGAPACRLQGLYAVQGPEVRNLWNLRSSSPSFISIFVEPGVRFDVQRD